MKMKPKILIVDDKIANLIALEKVLAKLNVEFIRAMSGEEALMKVIENEFALALIDVQMPEMDGFETVEIMRQDTQHLPIIFISAIYNEDYYKIKGIEAGAVDFINKPIVPKILQGKVRIFLELYEQRKQLEEQNQALLSAISKRKRAENELKQHQEHLEKLVEERTAKLVLTNKHLIQAKEEADSANHAKSEFLANMSHEIRTPMNAVIGFSDILASKVTDKQQKSYLNSIQTAGKSLLTLIDDILDLSKIEAGLLEIQYEPVNPQAIFTELQQIFSIKMAEKNLELIMEIDESLPSVLFLDETRLRQVLLNLIGNAVKFTDSGYLKLCANKEAYTNQEQIDLILAVEDSGIGIPSNQQAFIFESFRQVDGQSTREYGGTGLGLAITKRLVDLMNGEISVESNPGKGSRFEIILHEVKVAVTQPTVMQYNTFDSNNITFEKARVLVVDDIELNRQLIEECLSQVNLDVVSAENGEKALLFAEEYHPALILMDLRMPEMDGYEAAKRLKDNPNTADIPIIALTASVALNKKAQIEAHGFDGFLSKPVNISNLLRELSCYLKYSQNVVAPQEAAPTEVVETLNLENIVNLSELREKVETEVMPLWEETSIVVQINAATELAEKMIKLGNEYNVPVFIHYGESLQENLQTFEIVQIQKAIKELPVLVKPLLSAEA
jgi:signal transduction histidine kinase